jgi:hypothetical protein
MDSINRIAAKVIAVSAAAILMIGCGNSPSEVAESKAAGDQDGVVKSDVVLGKVGMLSKVGVLHKGAAITLRKVQFILTSSAADTVRDEATVSGNEQVVLNKSWVLKPLRTWTIHAVSLDSRDSVIHEGSTASFYVKPADTVSVNLSLTSRFTMYEARFNALPDSISSTTAGTGKDKINIGRVSLQVDGALRADSSKATYFEGNQNVTVFYDYVTPGSHDVILEAHGKLNGYEGVLYRGMATFDVAAGVDETRTVTLNWVGPTTGSGTITVTLGRVGKVVVNGTLPGSVIP